MRRRDSKDQYRAYKLLLDTFVESTKTGDAPFSAALYDVMQTADQTGRLAAIAHSYIQAISSDNISIADRASSIRSVFEQDEASLEVLARLASPTERPPGLDLLSTALSSLGSPSDAIVKDSPCSDQVAAALSVLAVHQHEPYKHIVQLELLTTNSLNTERTQLHDFATLSALWSGFEKVPSARQVRDYPLPTFAYDSYICQTIDPLSNAIIAFRDGARHMLQAGASISDIIGGSNPCLDTYIRGNNHGIVSAWSWACQVARASPHLSRVFQLATIYIIGIQMRFLICPSVETYNDLPPMLRPQRLQYTVPHAAGIDICQFPALRDFFLTHEDRYDNFELLGQSCNWQYSDAACLSYHQTPEYSITMSQAFIEHVRTMSNYSVTSGLIEKVPGMAQYVA